MKNLAGGDDERVISSDGGRGAGSPQVRLCAGSNPTQVGGSCAFEFWLSQPSDLERDISYNRWMVSSSVTEEEE